MNHILMYYANCKLCREIKHLIRHTTANLPIAISCQQFLLCMIDNKLFFKSD